MDTPILRLPLLAAALVVLGSLLAWLASPGSEGAVLAAEPAGPIQGPEPTGVLDVTVHGLRIPYGAATHAEVHARLEQLPAGVLPHGELFTAHAPVMDGRVAFGDLPMDEHFGLTLTGPDGAELLRTTVLGPGHGLESPRAAVKVSLAD